MDTLASSHPVFAAMVEFLVGALGKEMTAYVSGLCDIDAVREWRHGHDEPQSALVRKRVETAFDAAVALAPALGEDGVGSWFFGTNHYHDGNAPAWVIRHAKTAADLAEIVPAARAFAWS